MRFPNAWTHTSCRVCKFGNVGSRLRESRNEGLWIVDAECGNVSESQKCWMRGPNWSDEGPGMLGCRCKCSDQTIAYCAVRTVGLRQCGFGLRESEKVRAPFHHALGGAAVQATVCAVNKAEKSRGCCNNYTTCVKQIYLKGLIEQVRFRVES
ncbi:hypothetical protein L7F22_031859 [Adiantum nelumboides]|nr:hypothetical protein [Adiantum nelumboides]